MRTAGLLCILVSACGRIGFASLGDADVITIGDGSRPDIVFQTNVAFVSTPTAVPGSFSTLAAADAFCQANADQSGLPGTYIAWLSTTGTNAIDRLAGSRGWVRPDGVPFVDTPADLVAARIWSPLSVMADGTDAIFGNVAVVTGATAAGGLASSNCTDWTDPTGTTLTGQLSTTSSAWTFQVAQSLCGGPARIYCFGVGLNVPVTTSAPQGRRAFLSKPTTLNGIAALDNQCQSEAAALGGTFRAFVATTTSAAGSRFDANGARWERLDGIPLAPLASDLLITGLRAPLNLDATGVVMTYVAWTGATTPSAMTSTTCSDWTTSSPSGRANWGDPQYGGSFGFGRGSSRCDLQKSVYCLEL